jgi:DNA adenine methylase
MESRSDLLGDMMVSPTEPAVGYLGGKSRLAKTLVPMIDRAGARIYAEPFIGMGGIFLRRKVQARVEVINDYSRDVSTFFRILQRHYTQFVEILKYQITTRAEFERLSRTDPETLTDLERAARFLYLQSCAFGGNVGRRSFGLDLYKGGGFNLLSIVPKLEALHARLAGVVIENLCFDRFIERIDKPETLFYLDPPYWGGENDYGKGLFSRSDFARLADQLRRIKGRFILSINDVPEIRLLFDWAEIEPVDVRYSVGDNSQIAKELIIKGGTWHQAAK